MRIYFTSTDQPSPLFELIVRVAIVVLWAWVAFLTVSAVLLAWMAVDYLYRISSYSPAIARLALAIIPLDVAAYVTHRILRKDSGPMVYASETRKEPHS